MLRYCVGALLDPDGAQIDRDAALNWIVELAWIWRRSMTEKH